MCGAVRTEGGQSFLSPRFAICKQLIIVPIGVVPTSP
jgi:hypothetical protein